MKRFVYKVRDKTGNVVRGRVEAASEHDAARLLRDRGYFILSITPQREFPLLSVVKNFSNKVTLADVTVFTRQFSTMVAAGMPITDALVIIRSQSKANIKPVIGQILTEVEGGSSLANALEKHQSIFSVVYVSLVRAGETGGVLDKLLLRLADNLENQREFQAKVKGALIYPAIVVTGMIVVGAIMIIFVIPRITSIYQDFGAELPTATKVLLSIADIGKRFWFLLPTLGFFFYWGYSLYSKTPEGRERIDQTKLDLPIIGKLKRQVILTEFSRTLGLLVGAGIPILEGLKVVSEAVDNIVVEKAIQRVSEKVEKGFSLGFALSQEPQVFPPMLYQMLAAGEETGKVDETLGQVSKVFEQESGYAVRALTAAIEPVIMIVMGIGVAALVIAVIMPIFSLSSQF